MMTPGEFSEVLVLGVVVGASAAGMVAILWRWRRPAKMIYRVEIFSSRGPVNPIVTKCETLAEAMVWRDRAIADPETQDIFLTPPDGLVMGWINPHHPKN